MNADQKWKQEYQQQKHKQKIQQAKATLPQDCRSLKTTGSTRVGLETRTTYHTNIQKDEIAKTEDSTHQIIVEKIILQIHQRGRALASFEDRVVQYQEPLFDTLKERGLQQYSKELNSRGYGNIVEVVSRFNNDDFESLLSSLKVLPGHNDKFRQLRSDVLRELPEINPNKKKTREASEKPHIEQRVDEIKKARLQSQGSGRLYKQESSFDKSLLADGLQKVAKGRKLRGVRIKEIGADYFLDSTDLSREQRELMEELCSNIQRVEREYVVHSEDDTDQVYGTKPGPIRHKPSVETSTAKVSLGKNEVYEVERKSKTAPSNPGAYTLKGPTGFKKRNPNLPPINDHNSGKMVKTSDLNKTKVPNRLDADKELDEYLDDQTSNDQGPHEGFPRTHSKGKSEARANSRPAAKGGDHPPKQPIHGTKASHKASQASQPSHPSYAKASTIEPPGLSSPSNHTRHHQSQYKQSIEVHSIGSGGDVGHRKAFDTSDDGEIEDLTGKLGSHEDNFNEYIDHDAVYLQQPVKVSKNRTRSSDKARSQKDAAVVAQRRNSRGPVPKPPKANNLLAQTAEQRNQVSANTGGPGSLAHPRGRSQNRSLKDEPGQHRLNATAPNTHPAQQQQPSSKKEPRRSDSQGRGVKAVVAEPKARTAPTPPGKPPTAAKGAPPKPAAPKPAVKPPKKFQSQELRGGASTDQEDHNEEMHPGKRFEEEFEDLTDNPPMDDFDDEFEETPDEIVDQVDFEEVFTYEKNLNSPEKVSSSYDEKFATKHFHALRPDAKATKHVVSQKPAEEKLKSKVPKDKQLPQTLAKELKPTKSKVVEPRTTEQPSALGVKQPSSKKVVHTQNNQPKNKEFGAPNVQAKQPQEVNPAKMKKAQNPTLVVAEEGPAVMKTAEPRETRIPTRALDTANQGLVREEGIRTTAGAKKLISQPHLKGDSSEADMLEYAEQQKREPANSARQKSNRSDTTDTKDHMSEGRGEDPSPQTPDSNPQHRISTAIEQKKKHEKQEGEKTIRSSKSLPLAHQPSPSISEGDDVRLKLIQRMNSALEHIQTDEKPGELNMRFADIKRDVYRSFDGVKLTSTILNIDIDELCYCYGKVIIQHLLNFRDMEVSQEEETDQKPQSPPKGTLDEQDITESIAIIGKTIQDRLQGDLQANLSDYGGVQESGLMLDDSDSGTISKNQSGKFDSNGSGKLPPLSKSKDKEPLSPSNSLPALIANSSLNKTAPQQKLEIISERSEDTDSQAHLQSGKEPLPSPKMSDSRIQYLDDDIDPNDIVRLSMSVKTRYEYIFEEDLDVKNMKAHQVFDRVFNDEEIYSDLPEVEAIRDYVLDVIVSCKMEKEILMASLVYLERVLIRNDYPLTMQNWRRLVLISLIVASKIWDDESFENHNFAKVFSTYETEDINEMERMFLERIDYDLEIPTADYTKYYFVLRVFADKRHRGPQLRELDLPTVLQLQNDPRNAKENLMERYGNPLLKSYGS